MIFTIKEKVFPQLNARRIINRFAWLPTNVEHTKEAVGPRYRIWLESYQVLQTYCRFEINCFNIKYYWEDKVKFLSEKSHLKIMSKTLKDITKSLTLHT